MKILYVSTISNTINAFMVPHIEILLKKGHQVDIACNIKREINPRLLEQGCKVFNLEFERSPFKKSNYLAYKKLKKLVQDEEYDIVHTHTPVASACVRLACRKIGETKVVYTAHGFHFFKGAPLKNWCTYYPVEYWLARYTDVLITINKEDYTRAKKSFKAGTVTYIPGIGLNTRKFNGVGIDKSSKRKELGVPEDAFTMLSVGELNRNKNHEVVIKALAKLNNPNIYYLVCGQGPLESYLRKLSKELGLEKQVKLLGYRSDIADICKSVDIFVFPSFREGLPVSVMEAMASGLPVICSKIRGNSDLIENNKGGVFAQPTSPDSFARAILNLYNDYDLRLKMSLHNEKKIGKFDIQGVQKDIVKIYCHIEDELGSEKKNISYS